MRITTSFKFFITNIRPPHEVTELILSSSYVDSFWFIESIESAFMYGQITLLDKVAALESLNFTGKEIIKVIMQQELIDTDNNPVIFTKMIEFEIYDTIVENMKLKDNTFTLALIEKGAMNYYSANFNKAYTNKNISDIMKDVMTTQLKYSTKEIDIEPTFDKIENFVIPFWKPMLTIKSLRKKARRLKTPHEGCYLFYSSSNTGIDENKTPLKHFVSFSSLLENNFTNDIYHNYHYKNYGINQYYINNIKEMEVISLGSRSVLKNGIGGKRYFGVDYNTDKNIIESKQKYTEYIKKTKLLGGVAFLDKTIDNFNDDVDFVGGPSFVIESAQDNSFRTLLTNYNLREFVVEGALFREVGQVIFIEHLSDSESRIFSKMDFGKWVVKAITHHYEHGYYTNKIAVIRDSYTDTDLTDINVIRK